MLINIGGRLIGSGQPCFIIAEAGVNHNGDPELARRLIDAAVEVGTDAVKFQTWVTEKLVAPDAIMADYQIRNLGGQETQFQMLKRLELSYAAFRDLQVYAATRGILFLSTPDEEDSADFLESLGVPAFKIGSGEVTNGPFLHHIARKHKPIILSTGMSTLSDVEAAVQAIEAEGHSQIILLHCVSDYPAELATCNLRAMDTLRTAFGYPVGFSDHTLGIEAALAAVAREACVIEKHLTLDKSLPGPDHAASLDVGEFQAMVRAVRGVESALGTGRKLPTVSEQHTRQVVQKMIVARRDLPANHKLALTDLALRRAQSGLPPFYLDLLTGHTTKRSIAAGTIISWEDLA